MNCVVIVSAVFLLLPSLGSGACIPFEQANKHIGETECVTGRVIRAETGSRGAHYLDFCEEYRLCPFSVVVFPYDLKKVGDVRQLAGRVVEVRGELKECDGPVEIVLEDGKQLGAETVRIAPLPKSFDAGQRGHFSTGQ